MSIVLNKERLPFHQLSAKDQHGIIAAKYNNEHVEFLAGCVWVTSDYHTINIYSIYRCTGNKEYTV